MHGRCGSSPKPRKPVPPATEPARELLAAYGENDLVRHHIPLDGGAVKVQGSGIPAGHTVWVAGRQVPVDPQGRFAAEEVLPAGAHTVEVAVLDEAGNGSLYLRDLEFKRRDLFYVGVADLTLSESSSSGPAELLQGENAQQPFDSSVDGRLAFYVNGKVNEHWRLTASADTREGPLDDIFSNFLDKSPESLFRRIDPDYYYPTFGDDSVVEEMAPTPGQVLRQGQPRRELRPVGQLQGRLHGKRAGSRGPRPLRRERALPVGEHHQLRREAARPGRLRRRAGNGLQLRGVQGNGRVALLPTPPGHPGRLRARAHRGPGQGLGHRHGGRQPAPRDGL